MSVRNIVDGTFDVSESSLPIIFEYNSTSISPPGLSITLTFIKTGQICTMILNPFQFVNAGGNILFGLPDTSTDAFMPRFLISSNIIVNNAAKTLGTLNFDPVSKTLNLSVSVTGAVFNLDETQSINYITAF